MILVAFEYFLPNKMIPFFLLLYNLLTLLKIICFDPILMNVIIIDWMIINGSPNPRKKTKLSFNE